MADGEADGAKAKVSTEFRECQDFKPLMLPGMPRPQRAPDAALLEAVGGPFVERSVCERQWMEACGIGQAKH